MIYKISENERKTFEGMSEVTYLTRQNFNKKMRNIFDSRIKAKSNIIAIHHQPDPNFGGIIYENIWRMDTWCWSADGNKTTVGFLGIDNNKLSLDVDEIVSIVV